MTKKALIVLLALMLAVVTFGLAGCNGDTSDDATTDTESSDTSDDEATTGEGNATGEAGDEDAGDMGGSDVLTAEQADGALDIAQAYFVAKTDFTADQFDFGIVAAAIDDTGQWWARVSANPNDMSLETEQIYVILPPEMTLWVGFDMGTGIDDRDMRFPEEVRDQLW